MDGQYVGVLVQDETPTMAILVPQSALQIDQQGTFVLIVDAEQQGEMRRIQTGPAVGADVVVREGLTAGDLVITEGIQKVRPGNGGRPRPRPRPSTAAAQGAVAP